MSEPEMKALIDRLQRANRRWKILAWSSASVLAVLLIAAGVSGVVQWKRVVAEREIALQMYQEAMAQAEQLQREAEEARKAEEKVRKEAEKAKNQEQQSKEEVERMLYHARLSLAQQQFNNRDK